MGALAPGKHVLLEAQPGFPYVPNESGDPAVTVRRFRRNGYVLSLQAPRAGLIYCSESYFPGWRAKVNGRRTDILPANYGFRAVPVPAGPVVVELAYWPPGMTAGLTVSIVALLALAWIFALGKRERRSQAPNITPSGSTESAAVSDS